MHEIGDSTVLTNALNATLANWEKFCASADAQLWCVFRPRFALSKEGFCFKLITVRRIFIKSVVSHPMIIRESPHSI